MKNARFLFGGLFLIMAVNSLEATTVTKLQKLMAQKVQKLPVENNPAIGHKLTADPAVLVYNDTVYIYGSNDAQQAETTLGEKENTYDKICSLNVFSSKDLVNWTDCGEIFIGGRQNSKGAAKWANNSWAPAICTKKINGVDKFFLYFADNGNGIGVLTSDSPTGPFIDPIKKPLVGRSTKNCQKVYWLFDPAVFVDDDGTGYLYFGGGVANDPAHPKSARVAKLADDMISLACDPIEIDAPWLFEDSGINKFGNKYYYSYCANWSDRTGFTGPEVPPTATIAYMTSDSPLGPFTYQGYTLKNPGSYFGPWGNNHHWIFQFKDKTYIAYHAQTVEKKLGFAKGGYRSIFINDFKIEADGSLPIQAAPMSGVSQVCSFNPYETVAASTMQSCKNIAVTGNLTAVAVDEKAYIFIKGVDVSKGLKKITVETTADCAEGTIAFSKKNLVSSNKISELKVKGKGTFTVEVSKVDLENTEDIYISMTNGTEIISWKFE